MYNVSVGAVRILAAGHNDEILFLDADDNTLVNRYKETRRMHPLVKDGGSLLEGIKKEREMLYARAQKEELSNPEEAFRLALERSYGASDTEGEA